MINATITVKASELIALTDPKKGALTRWILSLISKYLDEYGAADRWNLRFVAVISALVLGIIRYTFGKKRGIDWCAFVHAFITTLGALACWYLDTYFSSALLEANSVDENMIWSEPMRTVAMCAPPLTSLHRILASITLGYSLLDFFHGLTLGTDFLFHGIITMGAMGYVVEMNAPQVVSSLLLMELSTIFLSLVRADFFNETAALVNMGLFVLTFIGSRCIWVPYLWWKLLYAMILHYQTYKYQACFHPSFMDSVFVSGVFFHLLNAYWLYKIIQKVKRKLTKVEGITDKNDLIDQATSPKMKGTIDNKEKNE